MVGAFQLGVGGMGAKTERIDQPAAGEQKEGVRVYGSKILIECLGFRAVAVH